MSSEGYQPGLANRMPDFRQPVPDFSLREPVGSFIETCRLLVTGPVHFFAGLPARDGYRNPLAFGVICMMLATIVGTLLGFGLQALVFLPLIGQGSAGDFPFTAATAVLVLLGVAMAVSTLARGGGPLAFGVLIGVMFAAVGAGRLWLARGERP